jgi:hypothetical protein
MASSLGTSYRTHPAGSTDTSKPSLAWRMPVCHAGSGHSHPGSTRRRRWWPAWREKVAERPAWEEEGRRPRPTTPSPHFPPRLIRLACLACRWDLAAVGIEPRVQGRRGRGRLGQHRSRDWAGASGRPGANRWSEMRNGRTGAPDEATAATRERTRSHSGERPWPHMSAQIGVTNVCRCGLTTGSERVLSHLFRSRD